MLRTGYTIARNSLGFLAIYIFICFIALIALFLVVPLYCLGLLQRDVQGVGKNAGPNNCRPRIRGA